MKPVSSPHTCSPLELNLSLTRSHSPNGVHALTWRGDKFWKLLKHLRLVHVAKVSRKKKKCAFSKQSDGLAPCLMLLRTLISEKTVAQRKEATFPEAIQSPGSTPGLKTPAPCTYAQFSFHRSVRCKKECSVGSTQVPMPDLSRYYLCELRTVYLLSPRLCFRIY